MHTTSTIPFIAALALLTLMAAAQEPPAVTVTGGPLQGALVKGGGAVFKGIPFAAPPLVDLRWREPMPGEAVDRCSRGHELWRTVHAGRRGSQRRLSLH